jgi:putative membrane protein
MTRTLISAAVIVGISSAAFAQDDSGRTREDQMQEQPGRIIIKDNDDQNTGSDTSRTQTQTQTRTERDTTGRTGAGAAGNAQAGDASGGAAMQAGARATAQIDTNETIKALNSANEFEIQLSQHAQQNGQDPQVKQLAQQMVRDHQQAKQQLQQLAQRKNVQLDSKLMEHHQAQLDHFKSKRGAELDAMYAFHEAGDHMHNVLKHQYLSTNAQDQDLRQFAQQMLPTLQQHLQHVTSVAQGIAGAEGAAMPASGRMEGSMNNTGSEINRTTRTEIRSGGTTGAGASGSVDTNTGTRTHDSNVAGPRDEGETRHDAGAGTTGNRTGGTGTGSSGNDATR